MAPKKEQAAPITPTTVATGLAAAEPSQQLQALLQLANAAFSPDDIIQSGIPEKLVSLLQQLLDKSVTLLACRQLASYAAGRGPLQQTVASLETVQAVWSVLSAYHAAEHAVAAALADPAAAKAAAPKKPPAPKDAVDPDDWLPGPSKYLLEACLRAMSSLLNPVEAQQRDAGAAVDSDANGPVVPDTVALVGSSPEGAALLSWVMGQDVAVLVCLLRHPSARVQMRAVRLLHQLARSSAWSDAFTAAAGVAAATQLATASSLTVRLYVLRLLLRLADNSCVSGAVMLQSKQLMDALVVQLLEAGAQASTAPVAGSGKGKAAQHAATDAKSEPALVQQAAADLLALLCFKSSSMSQQLVQLGGLTALQALLPGPPPPPSAEDATSSITSVSETGALNADGTNRSPRQKQPASKQPTPRGATPADAAKQATPRGTTPATDAVKQATPRAATPAGGDSSPTKGTPRGTPPPGNPQPEGEAAGSRESAEPDSYPTPAGKVLLPEIQAKVLHVLAAVMSQPGMVQSMLMQAPAVQAGLPRLLLHMFAPGPVVVAPAATDSQDVAQAAADTAGQAAAATGGKAGAAGKAGVTIGASAKGPAAAAGSGTAAKGAAVAAKKEQAAGAAASGNSPRKIAAPAAKEPPKTPDTSSPLTDPLAPPYSAITKAAALECLAHLAKDKQAVMLLAEQRVQLPAGVLAAADTASSAGASGAALQQGQQREQQQHQQSAMGISMLQQLLQDLLKLAGAKDMQDANATGSSSNGISTQPADKTGAAAQQEQQQQQQQPPVLTTMLEGAAAVLGGLAEHLDRQQLQELPLLPALKGLAQCGLAHQASLQAQQAIARALLLLPEELFVAPPRPPLPSPPATPPAPPLPTSQFAWDALDRPYITDGLVILTTNA